MAENTVTFDRDRYRQEVRERLNGLSRINCVAFAARAAWRASQVLFVGWNSDHARERWWKETKDAWLARLTMLAGAVTNIDQLSSTAAAKCSSNHLYAYGENTHKDSAYSESAAFALYSVTSASACVYNGTWTDVDEIRDKAALAAVDAVDAVRRQGLDLQNWVMALHELDLHNAQRHKNQLIVNSLLWQVVSWSERTTKDKLDHWLFHAQEAMRNTPEAAVLHDWLNLWNQGRPPIDDMRGWFNHWWLKHPENKERTPAYSDMPTTLATEPTHLAQMWDPELESIMEHKPVVEDQQSVPITKGENPEPPPQPTSAPQPEEKIVTNYKLDSTVAFASDREAKELTPTSKRCKEGLALFLASKDTQAPLTASVEAPWGAGKTSFMSHLRKALEAEMIPTVWFNPWKHEAGKTMWAAFALAYERQMGEHLSGPGRLFRRVGLTLARLSWAERMLLVLRLGLWVAAGWALWWLWQHGMKPGGEAKVNTAVDLLIKGLPWVGGPVLVWRFAQDVMAQFGSPLKMDVVRLFTESHHEDGVDDLHRFHEDFARLMRAYHPANGWWARLVRWWDEMYASMDPHWKERWHTLRNLVLGRGDAPMPEPPKRFQMLRVVVFIDDLDRCEAPKAADVLQSLHLMLNVTETCAAKDEAEPSRMPGMICVLGMDREKVAAAVAAKHEKLLPMLLELDEQGKVLQREALRFGHEFLEKFVQLTMHLPGMVGDDRVHYLKGITGWKEPEKKAPVAPASPSTAARQTTPAPDARESIPSAEVPRNPMHSTRPPAVRASEAAAQAELETLASQARLQKVEELLHDSNTIYDCATYVAEALENNPRRLKQFVNLLRLRLYLAAALELLDVRTVSAGVAEVDKDKLSVHHLAKLVALDLMCPQSMAKMRGNPGIWYSTLTDLAKAENAERSDAITVMLNHGRRLNPDPLRNLYVLDGAPLEAYFLQLATVAPAPMTGPVNAEDLIEDMELAERRGRAGLK